MEQFQSWFGESAVQTLTGYAVGFCKNIIAAIVIYFVGKWLIQKVVTLVERLLEKRKAEASLKSFLSSVVRVGLWLMLTIAIISVMGIETSSFVALFTGAGMAIGMAISGMLGNFAGGVIILMFKPFKVGDFIEAQGYAGTVKEIQIFNTIIRTNDAQTIIIPNGGLSTGSMKNYSTEPYRRVDVEFQFAYGTDLEQVKEAISEIQQRTDMILKEPVADSPVTAPWIGLSKLGESGVVVNTRSWCKSADYWPVYFYMNETVYQELKERGFMFPYNKLDVNIIEKVKD